MGKHIYTSTACTYIWRLQVPRLPPFQYLQHGWIQNDFSIHNISYQHTLQPCPHRCIAVSTQGKVLQDRN
jgi:hypothetical protein